jgi:hypothetical protein
VQDTSGGRATTRVASAMRVLASVKR